MVLMQETEWAACVSRFTYTGSLWVYSLSNMAEKPPRSEKPVLEKNAEILREHLQIVPATGIAADYFNEMFVFKRIEIRRILHPDIVPLKFQGETEEATRQGSIANEKWARDLIVEVLRKIRTYSEYLEYQLEDFPDKEKLHELLVPDSIKGRVQEMDTRVVEMRGLLRDDPTEIDVAKLNRLAFEVSCLIYGDKKIPVLEHSFFHLDESS